MADQGAGFFFNVEKWFADLAAARMSFAEKGVYLVMLFQQWREKTKSLPDDPHGVADLIAVNDDQAADIERAWPMVRRKFVTLDRDPGRIVNLKVEKTRRQQAAHAKKRSDAGRAAGIASAAKRNKPKTLERDESSTFVERSSTDKTRSDRIGSERNGSDRRAIPRARTSTIFDGSLPRDHVSHVFCDPSFSICVPPQVHAKLIGPLSRRFNGERGPAHQALIEWYPTVPPTLPPAFVMGDAFKFWQTRFDAEFATKDTPPVSPAAQASAYQAKVQADADAVLKLVQQDDAKKAAQR